MVQTLDSKATRPDFAPSHDLTAFYRRTADAFAAAVARKDWDAVALLDLIEAGFIERDRAAEQFPAEPVMDEEDEEEAVRNWCGACDLDAAA